MFEFFNTDFLSSAYYYSEQGPVIHGNIIYWIIIIGSMIVSWLVSNRMESRFRQFSQEPIPMSGKEIAEKMLRDHHIHDVKVISTSGHLTDHYNPANKTVNLSESVYHSNSIAAAAVAAHEVGHAVQHAQAYAWLSMRSALVPIVQFSSNLVGIVMLIGVILLAMGSTPWVLGAGIVLFAFTTLFAFVTLPVEFNASARALQWLERSHVLNYFGHSKAKSALFWAAMTYVVGALSSLAMLLYYVLMFLGARNRD